MLRTERDVGRVTACVQGPPIELTHATSTKCHDLPWQILVDLADGAPERHSYTNVAFISDSDSAFVTRLSTSQCEWRGGPYLEHNTDDIDCDTLHEFFYRVEPREGEALAWNADVVHAPLYDCTVFECDAEIVFDRGEALVRELDLPTAKGVDLLEL